MVLSPWFFVVCGDEWKVVSFKVHFRFERQRAVDSSTKNKEPRTRTFLLGHYHGPGAAVGEDLGEQRIAIVAADDMRAVNATP